MVGLTQFAMCYAGLHVMGYYINIWKGFEKLHLPRHEDCTSYQLVWSGDGQRGKGKCRLRPLKMTMTQGGVVILVSLYSNTYI